MKPSLFRTHFINDLAAKKRDLRQRQGSSAKDDDGVAALRKGGFCANNEADAHRPFLQPRAFMK